MNQENVTIMKELKERLHGARGLKHFFEDQRKF